MTAQVQYRLLSVGEVEQMVKSGILTEDDKIELIKGQLINMSPPGARHVASVNRLNTNFASQLQGRSIISIQNPIQLPPFSQPEPDAALLRPRDDYYVDAHPTAQDVLLLIEVADSSLNYDQDTKLPVYAAADVSEVWIFSLQDGWLDCYRHPSANGYRIRERFFPGDSVQPDAFPDVTIDVSTILGQVADR